MGIPLPFDEVRMQAWKILEKVEDARTFADTALDQAFGKNPHWKPLDRAFLMELVLGTLRWRGRLDHAIRLASTYPRKNIQTSLLQLLRVGTYQILFLDRVPDSAAVNESVRLAKAIFKNVKMSAFVNAVLRNIARRKDQEAFPSFLSSPAAYLTQALSHPPWMVERWMKDWGPEITREICAANNLRPPFTVRANTLKISREDLRERYEAAGMESLPTPFSPEGLILKRSPSLTEDVLFQGGLYFVQDEASQMISHLLAPRPGERVLDACAAPGGKTTHLAQLMGGRGEIIALDLQDSKLKAIRENCRRLGITVVKTIRADASQSLPFSSPAAFDRILVDAPCTGLGILHRNPEIKWRRKPQDPSRYHARQLAILENISSRLKRKGILVYSTCTMTREENDSVVEVFLGRHTDFQLEDAHFLFPDSWHSLIDARGFLRTYPRRIIPENGYRLDGFFAARMKRQ